MIMKSSPDLIYIINYCQMHSCAMYQSSQPISKLLGHKNASNKALQCYFDPNSYANISISQEQVIMQFRAHKLDKKDFFGKSDPFLTFYRASEDGRQGVLGFGQIYNCVMGLCLPWYIFLLPVRRYVDICLMIF